MGCGFGGFVFRPRFGATATGDCLYTIKRKLDCGSDAWVYEPRLDTRAATCEEAIVELAYKLLKEFRW